MDWSCHATDRRGPFYRDEKLLKLQRKVQRLQEELTDKLRCVGREQDAG